LPQQTHYSNIFIIYIIIIIIFIFTRFILLFSLKIDSCGDDVCHAY